MRKKGLEISINFLVMIIISLVIFIFALMFAFRFFGQAEQYQKKIEQSTRQELENLIINQGYKVAAYPTQLELHSGKDAVVGVGIFSVGFEGDKEFLVNISCAAYINMSERLEPPHDDPKKCGALTVFYSPPSIKIGPNKDYIYSVYIKNNGAWRGTYVINAEVKVEGARYGDVQKIYVRAK